MSLLVADCPRCGAKNMTFEVTAGAYRGSEHGWKQWFEVFSICRACNKPTTFLITLRTNDLSFKPDSLVAFKDALNKHFEVDRFIGLRDTVSQKAPEHLTKEITDAFDEGAACLSIGCNNAAAAMFRLCIDLVTKPLLTDPNDAAKPQPPNNKTRRDLGLRLTWMFDSGILPSDLRGLAKCVREDGNDGAHMGNLTRGDAEDLLDFTTMLLERLITEPKRLELAQEPRAFPPPANADPWRSPGRRSARA
jgi:hypothetical protein